jgi:hypothetical protein
MKRTSIFHAAFALIALQLTVACGAVEDDVDAGYQEPAAMSLPDDEQELETTQASLLASVKCSSSTIKCDGKCYPKSKLKDGCQTCKKYHVFRDAFRNDKVCVETGIKVNRQYENQFASQNVDPACRANPSSCPYGKDQCKQGFVWRDCVPGDHVCVTASSRAHCQQENRAHRSNTVIWGN